MQRLRGKGKVQMSIELTYEVIEDVCEATMAISGLDLKKLSAVCCLAKTRLFQHPADYHFLDMPKQELANFADAVREALGSDCI